MKITVHIDDKAYNAKEPYPDAGHVVAQDAPPCPSCGANTFYGGPTDVDHDTMAATAHCASCKVKRGRIVVKVSTIFGIQEDLAVGQRCRVY